MYTGIVYDALKQMGKEDQEFLLQNNIKPLEPDYFVSGRVFTTFGEKVEVDEEEYQELDKIRLEIYPRIQGGDIVMLQANDNYFAHSGDITTKLYKMSGADGFITDGAVRDARLIRQFEKFPTFCTKTTPIDALGHWALTKYEVPIYFKPYGYPHYNNMIEIVTGDYVCGDQDGVIVVKSEWLEEFRPLFVELTNRENTIRKSIGLGDSAVDVMERYGRW